MIIKVSFVVFFCLFANFAATSFAWTVLGHMANHARLVDWYMEQRVNGLEVDLRFNGDTPTSFQHSTHFLDPCDCSVPTPEMCSVIFRETGYYCRFSADFVPLLAKFVQYANQLAVVYFDSKVDRFTTATAGRNLIQALDVNLFGRGFRGQVIISAPDVDCLTYLRGAVEQSRGSPNATRYFFTIDGVKDETAVFNALNGLNIQNQLVFSTGITALLPGFYAEATRAAAARMLQGTYKDVGIWTLDSETSIANYLSYGATSVVTNVPANALAVFGTRGLTLSTPGNAIRTAAR